MIIITAKPGQLGNSLLLYANFLSFARENNLRIYNPSFNEYSSYFTATDRGNKILNQLTFYFFYYFTRLLVKLKSENAFTIDWHEVVNLDNPDLSFKYRKKLYFVQGWQYRCNKLIQKFRNENVDFFTPAQHYRQILDSFFSENFIRHNEIIIGIHIRRGDFENFEGGKYFYSVQQYINVMNRLLFLFAGQKIHFLVCSNEKLSQEDFNNVNARVTFGLNHELLDMYSFARCNYITGPPSTYTMWASYYGNVPLYMLHDIDSQFSIEDFQVRRHLGDSMAILLGDNKTV
jgi:hypothetical protein